MRLGVRVRLGVGVSGRLAASRRRAHLPLCEQPPRLTLALLVRNPLEPLPLVRIRRPLQYPLLRRLEQRLRRALPLGADRLLLLLSPPRLGEGKGEGGS